jgi:hypothetical protein
MECRMRIAHAYDSRGVYPGCSRDLGLCEEEIRLSLRIQGPDEPFGCCAVDEVYN